MIAAAQDSADKAVHFCGGQAHALLIKQLADLVVTRHFVLYRHAHSSSLGG